jgi:hypothetical protein
MSAGAHFGAMQQTLWLRRREPCRMRLAQPANVLPRLAEQSGVLYNRRQP